MIYYVTCMSLMFTLSKEKACVWVALFCFDVYVAGQIKP